MNPPDTTRPSRSASRRTRRLLPLLGFLSLGPLLLATAPPDSLSHAIEVQRALIEERPGDGSVWSDLGNLLALDGDREGAEQAYEEALRLDPESFDAHYNLGVLLLGNERFEAGQSHLRKATVLDPGSAWASYHLGTSLRERGKRADAIRAYAEAFRLDPRLAFPDVNPDVIDNPWLTESLLAAHRGRPPRGNGREQPSQGGTRDQTSGGNGRDQVSSGVGREQDTGSPRTVSGPRTYSEPATIASSPRSYSEPERIAQLLVPRSASGELQPVSVPSSRAVTPPEPARPVPLDDRGRVVDSELFPPDVDDQPAPAPESRQLRRVAPEASAAPPAVIGVPAATAPRRRVGPGDLSGGGEVNENDDASGGETPPETSAPVTRFRPGRRSSAQLDLMLVPRGARAPDDRTPNAAAASR
jgi:hypothetical protein